MEAEKIKNPNEIVWYKLGRRITGEIKSLVIDCIHEYHDQFKHPPVSVMPSDYIEPELMPANDQRVWVNGRTLPVAFRIVAEDNYQILISALSKEAPKEQNICEVPCDCNGHCALSVSTHNKERETAIESPQKTYTREEVIKLIDEILQHPDDVIDACTNENTNWSAEDLLDIVE